MHDGRNFDLNSMGTRILRTSSLEENPSAFYLTCSIYQFVRNLKTLHTVCVPLEILSFCLQAAVYGLCFDCSVIDWV